MIVAIATKKTWSSCRAPGGRDGINGSVVVAVTTTGSLPVGHSVIVGRTGWIAVVPRPYPCSEHQRLDVRSGQQSTHNRYVHPVPWHIAACTSCGTCRPHRRHSPSYCICSGSRPLLPAVAVSAGVSPVPGCRPPPVEPVTPMGGGTAQWQSRRGDRRPDGSGRKASEGTVWSSSFPF